MQLILSSGTEFCSDLLLSACLHSDLEPVPMTLEAVVRATDATITGLKQGDSISVASEGYVFRVVQVKRSKMSANPPGFRLLRSLRSRQETLPVVARGENWP